MPYPALTLRRRTGCPDQGVTIRVYGVAKS